VTVGQNDRAEFQRLIERRRKFIDGLDANRGEINLDIFEDFYPDRAHFVYELLQNAEDAGATAMSFTLLPECLVCEHDGRPFTLEDVTSITGIHDSTKAKSQDKIGKFGVGFKSVFVYTQTPSIRSGDFSFQIVQQVLPAEIATDPAIGRRTRFELPFDNPKKSPTEAHAEIAAGLNGLDEKTLLFLTNLKSVKWRIGKDTSGEVLRDKHSDVHFEVLKESGGKTTSSAHFLKLDQAVPGLERQRVAVAFPLDLLPGVPRFEPGKPLAEQLKIIPAEPGGVAVFFPAVNETSGLRFHLHGPFVPAMSRASIKETDANAPLFEQLATLAARSLHRIKDLDLLTPEFLAVLPNSQDQIPRRYQGIRTAIVEEMKSEPLTPTHDRRHAPARRLIQARASLKSLLSEDDIAFLVSHDGEPPLWAIGAPQRNSRMDQFLTGLGIREWGIDQFIEVLRHKSREEDGLFPTIPDDSFLSWLKQKSPSWTQEFYALLQDEAGHRAYALKTLRIVRLTGGELGLPNLSFFAAENAGSDIAIVDKAAYTSGASKKQQDGAKSFLSEIGVREIGKAEQAELILKRRYTKDAELPDDATYLDDLKRFVALTEEQPDTAKMFSGFYIFQAEDCLWYRPGNIYLDKPYLDTGLAAYYKPLNDDSDPALLHSRYAECGIEAKSLNKFAQAVGVKAGLEIEQGTCEHNPERHHLFSIGGNWTAYGINRDYFIPKLDQLLQSPSLELSRLIWRTLVSLPAYPDVLQATFRRNASHGSHTAASRLTHELRAASWVPQGDGVFVRPADALRELLPEGFPFDPGYRWLKPLKFGETAARQSAQAVQDEATAKRFGFPDADTARRFAERLSALPESAVEELLTELENRNNPAIPDREPANPKRRAENVREQAANDPDKETELRLRSVPTQKKDDVKAQAETYLRERYRNKDGDMTCQICKGPLPFKLDDGREYFETVPIFSDLRKHHPQNYLALCPNHSAMFQLVNGSKETLREGFQAIQGNELPVVLAEKELTIFFNRLHVIDLKAVLEAEENLPPESSSEVPEESTLAESNG
jgi:hypothetical protein